MLIEKTPTTQVADEEGKHILELLELKTTLLLWAKVGRAGGERGASYFANVSVL